MGQILYRNNSLLLTADPTQKLNLTLKRERAFAGRKAGTHALSNLN
jgi:hypothetical protein